VSGGSDGKMKCRLTKFSVEDENFEYVCWLTGGIVDIKRADGETLVTVDVDALREIVKLYDALGGAKE